MRHDRPFLLRSPIRTGALAVAVIGGLGLAGCSHLPGSSSVGQGAVATLQSKSGSSTQGTVRFSPAGNKVSVIAEITGLKPNAEHGFHLHEKGDCSSADGLSAGGHFNPGGKPHGHLAANEHHAGDMPNLKADANGRATATFELSTVSIGTGAANDIMGKAVIVHRDPDDYKSQPVGNAGARLACGVIARS